jgi:hypothetical protein
MMDELISEVCAKTGLNQDQARSAVDAVLGLLKKRAPAPLATYLDGVSGGSAGADSGGEGRGAGSGGLANEASTLAGNLFGGRK